MLKGESSPFFICSFVPLCSKIQELSIPPFLSLTNTPNCWIPSPPPLKLLLSRSSMVILSPPYRTSECTGIAVHSFLWIPCLHLISWMCSPWCPSHLTVHCFLSPDTFLLFHAQFFLCCFVLFLVLGIDPVLGKHSPTELHPSPITCSWSSVYGTVLYLHSGLQSQTVSWF
jgi:hypothetical protein